MIAIKTLIITAIGPRVGLTLQESVRIGLLLSQGGEFGFVVFSLANRLMAGFYVITSFLNDYFGALFVDWVDYCRLGVLPLELNKLLIIVVVFSMALTPLLNDVGRKASEYIAKNVEKDYVKFLVVHRYRIYDDYIGNYLK